MKNAHERFGVLQYTKRMKDTTTRIRLRLDRFIGEVEDGGNGKAHLISVLGGDSDIGAIWAAVIEQNLFTVGAPGFDPLTPSLGEDAQRFRGSITIARRRPIRHLVAIAHPRLVQTGLDLWSFPDIFFYETGYSIYTLRQASRRSWRIGQWSNVNVKFSYYGGTMQEACLWTTAASCGWFRMRS